MNTEKYLDEQIKQALENLNAGHDPKAWEAFETRLDQDAANGTPSFDDVISGKLNSLEIPLAAAGWGMMEKMIEAEETAELLENEATVDNLIFEKLEKFEATFQPHHWQMMAHRLEEEFYLRYHILRYKAAEAGLMLLLLLTIVRFSPLLDNASDQQFDQPTWPTPSEVIPFEKAIPAVPSIPGEPIAAAQTDMPIAANSSSVQAQQPKKAMAKTSGQQAIFVADGNGEEDTNFTRGGTAMTKLPHRSFGNISAMAVPATLLESMKARRFMNNNMVTPGMNNGSFGNAALLASLSPQPVQSKYAWEVPQIPQRIFEKERQLRFSIFTNTDVAYVITPPNKYSVFDTLITTGQDTTLASGYGAGITVSWKKDKWEIQTGGIYSFKRYIPNTPVFLFETVNYYIREEFNGVQLDLLQIPLNVSYHFKDEGKWRVYGSVGASGHFVTSSVYEIKTKRTPSFSNFAMLPQPAGLPSDNKSIREEKDFPDGLLDGGSIHDNFYMTANFGLGMERFVSPRWSVFFQPNYQHHILTDGIGVNGDKLYNFSFYLGTKVNLK